MPETPHLSLIPVGKCLVWVLLLSITVLVTACGSSGDEATEGLSSADSTMVQQTPIRFVSSPTVIATPTVLESSPGDVSASTIDQLIDREDGVYGVVIMDSNGEVLYDRNPETPFVTASLYKLVLIADILRRVEAGELNLDTEYVLEPGVFDTLTENGDTYFRPGDAGGTATLRELLVAVGANSSNVAARTLLELTTIDALNQTAADIGMARTRLFANPEAQSFWPPDSVEASSPEEAKNAQVFIENLAASDGEVNLTTPMDMATYQLKALNHELISPYVSDQIVSILRQQQIRDRIPFLLPDEYQVANKPGNLIHVVNDTGIVFGPDADRIVTVLSEGTTWDGRASELIQRIALAAIGEDNIPPISAESMEEGAGPGVVFGPHPDPRDVIGNPPDS